MNVGFLPVEELLDITVDRYFRTAALVGSTRSCLDLVKRFEEIGVSEIACLIDFGVDPELVGESLHYLNDLREMCSMSGSADAMEESISEFMADLV